MPVLKRRSKMVSFRLSEQEYEAMMAGCLNEGSRSLSDFARSAACERAMGARDPMIQTLKDRVEELDRKLRDLVLQVAESEEGNGKPDSAKRIGPVMASLAEMYRKEG